MIAFETLFSAYPGASLFILQHFTFFEKYTNKVLEPERIFRLFFVVKAGPRELLKFWGCVAL